MILDEGRVLGWRLFTLCSLTSLSLGMVVLLKRGKADFEVVEKDIWEFFAYSTIQTSPQSNAIALLTSGVTRKPLVIARHRLQAVVDWVQLVFTATSFRQGARLLQTRTVRHRSIYCRQIAGQKQQPQSREALSNTISATEDGIIILYQSGDDRMIFTASNISEDAVLWQRPFRSQAPAPPHLTFYPPSGPSCCCSAARIISTFPTPRFEERERAQLHRHGI